MLNIKHNFFPSTIQEKLLDLFTGKNFPWYLVPTPDKSHPLVEKFCQNDQNIQLSYGLTNLIYRKNFKNSDITIDNKNILDLFVDHTEKNFNIKVKNPMRLYALLSLPNENYRQDDYLLPHVDFAHRHKTLLYYINNSDGDTFLFKEKCKRSLFDDVSKLREAVSENEFSKKTIDTRITPEQGKAILFNGSTYHSGSIPKQHYRYVLNFNFQ